ncbi:LysR family transcriptional regulator [Endozoicomonas elysicola]|uniref:LysR family transcriptional regulator n=1 Tax=Endozoicomonas elysicola TaxID=305900 RepID=A0A081KDB7_9GAMM|nr:LysR family transcriptional regulator [Endozoicomonas elysicola]KEI72143.1 LysR family transcriptional regulator [Endozoicomonas elysicola]
MNTDDLALFVHTADSGSITRAAEQLDITTATASAALKRLEKQLKVQLLIRSTRQLRLTAEGERFLTYCREALQSLEAGRASIHALSGKVAGELRVSAPSDLGRNLLLEWMDEIMDSHPDLSINLLLGDSLTDFYLDRVDLVIRYGELKDSSMVAFTLATIDRVLCASPAYLAAFGMPEMPDDLQKHNCLLFQMNNRLDDVWELTSKADQERIRIPVSGNRSANDSDIVRRWCLAGKGIACKSRLDMARDLRAGRLVVLLPDYQTPRITLNLICPGRQQITPAVLLLRDLLREKFMQLLGE